MSGRRCTMHGQTQVTLGELIAALEALPLTFRTRNTEHPKLIYFDFGRARPGRLESYRGSYAELSLTFRSDGRSPYPTAVELLEMLRAATAPGRTLAGYKGGEYRMMTDTPVWVAQWGESGYTAVVGVRDLGMEIVIDTAWCEF